MPENILQEPSSFRDRPINIDDTGKRKWIYAKQPKGKWYTRRTIVGWFFLSFLILAPFIQVNDHPFMRLDIVNRQFYLFGSLIVSQDTYLLAIIMAVTVVSIVLFTVAFGRLFCGWACPQTLFMELVFRPVEYLFDSNYRKGKRKPANKVRTIAKHITFFAVSVFFTNVFLMWFIGPEGVGELISSPVKQNLSGFGIMMGISGFYYWIYAFFREQVCTMICPYGRMQGVLLDSKSITVIYDYKRGEPRGAKSAGDCIDCKQCLSVCPTGIDIRNGTQLECVNCTACIDECNIVMKKIGKPRNLIRYDSVTGVENGIRSILNSRTIAYTIVLFALFVFLAFTVAARKPLDVTLLRMSGTLYQQVDEQTISNMYSLKMVNKTNDEKDIDIRLISPEGHVQIAGKKAILQANANFEAVVIIKIETANLSGKSTPIEVGFYEEAQLLNTSKLNFLGPKK
jgi:cytochrome c oxidase accessory protein FixG